ncbi:MAG: hypothetical protein RLZZ149_108, partial [Pseudomonadota bacterium]
LSNVPLVKLFRVIAHGGVCPLCLGGLSGHRLGLAYRGFKAQEQESSPQKNPNFRIRRVFKNLGKI